MKPFVFGTRLIKGLENFQKQEENAMKAVVWRGDMTVDIESVEDARIEASTDA